MSDHHGMEPTIDSFPQALSSLLREIDSASKAGELPVSVAYAYVLLLDVVRGICDSGELGAFHAAVLTADR